MSVIVTSQLGKRYGSRMGIDRVSLEVPEGILFGFLGPNGAGKTTTIRLLLGLLKPSAGSASLFGRNCWSESHRAKTEVGYLPGDLRLYPWLTCRSALRIFGRIRRRDLGPVGEELIEQFELDPDVRVSRMSRGMRQKMGLILALAHQPKLLILDEPTASLDPLMQIRLCEHLRTLARSGHTVFFSSHTLSEVEQLCDRIAIIRNGRVVADETLEDLRARAKRIVTISWQSQAKVDEIAAPGFIDVIDRDDRSWRATLAGSAVDLVRWSAGQPIEDLSISPPDLTHLFRQYYE